MRAPYYFLLIDLDGMGGLNIMVEDKTQDKELLNRTSKEEAPSQEKTLDQSRAGGLLSGIYRFFAKSKLNGYKFEGTLKSASEINKLAPLKPSMFNVQKINLKAINQVLGIILIGLVVLLFYISSREKPEVSSVVAAISKIKLLEVESKAVVAFKELPYYLDQIKKRNIFSVFEEKKKVLVKVVEPVKAPEPPPPPVIPIEQKAKNIKLIGISWGENPKAMIRNVSTQDVEFVSVGEKIDGTDLEIKKILKNEVILSFENQEMSLL